METTHETEKLDISDTVAEITNVISKHLTKVIEKVSNKNIDAIEFESLETKNGIKLWLIEDKTLPLVSVSFSFKGGSILDPINQDGVTNLMTSLLDEGTQHFTTSEYRLFKRENGIKISFSTSKERIEGTFQVVKPRIQEGFYLLFESINEDKALYDFFALN